jgi:hypothetical protein
MTKRGAKCWTAWVGAIVPCLGIACDSTNRQECKEQVSELVSYRAEAIERAFGDLVAVMPTRIAVKFVGPKDAEYKQYSKRVAYDPAQRSLIVPRAWIFAKIPNPIRASAYYWPFYENALYRETFPLITAVDNALWGAYLQEAARARGQTWPHENCSSLDLEKRLPCEMLLAGVAAHLTALRSPMFNSNRLDRIWPEDFSAFSKRAWSREDSRYQEVQRYGGLLLLEPLIDEFGVPPVLFYIAQTPFVLEDNSLRMSALRYQERAREWLEKEKEEEKRYGEKRIADSG